MSDQGGQRPARPVPANLVAMVGVAILVGGFAFVADEVLEGSTTTFDTAVTALFRVGGNLAVIAGPSWLQEAARDLTSLGSFTVLGLIVIASAVYLLIVRRSADAMFLVIAVVSGTIVSSTLKQVFNRPRPDVEASSHVFTASFPSGHAALSAVVFLTLGALLAKATPDPVVRWFLLVLASLIALLVGISRIYLGMHYPTDVIAGWCFGVSWALVCWVAKTLIESRSGSR